MSEFPVPSRRRDIPLPVDLSVSEIMGLSALTSGSPSSGIESVLEFIAYKIIKGKVLPVISKSAELNRQVELGPFRIDMVIGGGNRPVAVEVDGHDWHEKDKRQVARDRRKDRYLQLQSYFVARFTGHEVWADPVKVERELIQICHAVGL